MPEVICQLPCDRIQVLAFGLPCCNFERNTFLPEFNGLKWGKAMVLSRPRFPSRIHDAGGCIHEPNRALVLFSESRGRGIAMTMPEQNIYKDENLDYRKMTFG